MLTQECELEILKKLKAGILPGTLAREYNVAKLTITGIKQNERRICEFITTAESQRMTATRKIMQFVCGFFRSRARILQSAGLC